MPELTEEEENAFSLGLCVNFNYRPN